MTVATWYWFQALPGRGEGWRGEGSLWARRPLHAGRYWFQALRGRGGMGRRKALKDRRRREGLACQRYGRSCCWRFRIFHHARQAKDGWPCCTATLPAETRTEAARLGVSPGAGRAAGGRDERRQRWRQAREDAGRDCASAALGDQLPSEVRGSLTIIVETGLDQYGGDRSEAS